MELRTTSHDEVGKLILIRVLTDIVEAQRCPDRCRTRCEPVLITHGTEYHGRLLVLHLPVRSGSRAGGVVGLAERRQLRAPLRCACQRHLRIPLSARPRESTRKLGCVTWGSAPIRAPSPATHHWCAVRDMLGSGDERERSPREKQGRSVTIRSAEHFSTRLLPLLFQKRRSSAMAGYVGRMSARTRSPMVDPS